MLVDELVDSKVPTSCPDLYFTSFDLYVDTLRSKLISAFAFPHEHDFKIVPVWIVVDIVCDMHIDRIIFRW